VSEDSEFPVFSGEGAPFPENALLVVGNARAQSDSPITHRYAGFYVTFVVRAESGEIVDLEASVTLALTGRFIRGLFLGRTLARIDEELVEQVRGRYLGSSQKALIAAYRDAVKTYRRHRGEEGPKQPEQPIG
jgi:hypothetical protein